MATVGSSVENNNRRTPQDIRENMLSRTQWMSNFTLKQCLKTSGASLMRISPKTPRNSAVLQDGGLRLWYATSAPKEPQKTSPSVDFENIEVLQKHSDKWWDPVGQFKPLHTMNHVRVPFIRDGLVATGAAKQSGKNSPQILKGLHLLEVGCGGGILTEALARLHADVTAIDPSEELINVAQEHVNKDKDLSQRVTYLTDTIETHVCTNAGKYDAVILSEVIEHVNDQENFLKHCIDCTKPGGSIFLSTISKTFLSYAIGIILVEHIIKLIPKGTHEWEKFITPQETQRIFEKNNCSVITVNGIMYYPWKSVWEYVESQDLTYIQHAVKH
ncbi:ubiquinone biosynthesis O-methyltransferase, mitochondrial-like [Phlebotomus argentipes]|uniref:ubiquinone biosynthesis O-methyltransferase, mitochondrial-like n=1 Tax=Phlebotomus argentipes TaxID=94469 RepID=UPI0028929B3F|nr:ubiquinone biosynthesis O-methyltransferase, mitochondrial-like [Phlebotomus argentipes]